MSGTLSGSSVGILGGLIVLSLAPSLSHSQGLPIPPVRQLVDENGVDLMSGHFSVSQSDIDIGPPEANLAYTRSAATNYDGIYGYRGSSDVMLLITDALSPATVLIGYSTEIFDRSGSTFTAKNGMGSTLVFDSSTDNYLYTQRDGTVIRFPAPVTGESPGVGLRALSILEPDGTFTEFSNKKWTPFPSLPSVKYSRVQSIVNNAGYQLKFEYNQSSKPTTPTKVSALNRTLVYCDPTADTCGGTSGAPSATFEWFDSLEFGAPPPSVTATDAAGRQTRWTMSASVKSGWGVGGPGSVKSPAAAIDDTTADFETYGMGPFGYVVGVTSVTRRGLTWDYQILNWNSSQPTVRATDPGGNTREVTSDLLNGYVLTDRDGAGNTTSYQYDSLGRRTRITYPEGNYVQITYDARGNVTEVRAVAKPGSGLADIVTSAAYLATCDNPKTCNQPTSTTDSRGQVTDYTYDPVHGGVLTVTQPAPYSGAARPQVRYSYTPLYAWYKNSSGNLVQSPTPIYKLTGISSCRTTASCEGTADEVKTTFGYQTGSSSVGSNLLLTSVMQSSGDGALVATTTMTYDERGNRLTVDGPLAGTVDTVTTRYDILRRVVGVVGPDPDGGGALKRRALRYSYNADDNATLVDRGTVNGLSESDWSGFSVLEQLNVGYDAVGRNSFELVTAGGVPWTLTQFSYDTAGRLECAARRMNPATFGSPPASACTLGAVGSFGADRITRTLYDNAGRVTKVQTGYGTSQQRDETTLTYTNNGKVLTVADARGNITTSEYDGHDRLHKTRYPGPSGQSSTTDYEQSTYDGGGLVVERRLRDGQTIGFSYDGLGRLQTKNLPGPEPDVTYGYDNFHRPTSVTQPGHTLSFTYDALGRLRTETGPQGTLASDYDVAGRRTRFTWPDGFFVDYDYLVTGEMVAVRENGAVSGIGVLATFSYDDLARRTTMTRGNGTMTSYEYNGASRLEEFTQNFLSDTADQTVGMSYNPAGQITSRTSANDVYAWTESQNVSYTYAPNSLNQYLTVDSVSFSYDARGNLANLGSGAYGYSSENLLTSAPNSLTLTYDPLARLYQTTAATTVRFSYDGDQLVAEYNANNQLLRRYVHGPAMDEPIVWYEGSGISSRRWLHADERGSIVAVSNASGTVFAVNRYDEYGQPAATNAGRFQFTGQTYISEAKLYYFKARFYDAALGRFMQPDPIGYGSGMNLYAYAHADPIARRDPSGLQDIEEIIVPGTRPCPMDATCFRPGEFFDLDSIFGPMDYASAQEAYQAQLQRLQATIDQIVVTARKERKLAGIKINFFLRYPREQMWIVAYDGTITHIPTQAVSVRDSCGNTLAANRPAVEVPPDSFIFAVIHTHTKEQSAWPAAGDYTSALRFSVYNINPSGTWVLRHGAARGSRPYVLSGSAPTPPKGSGKTCVL